ncbi:hypothetical protein HN827_06770, partial [archaeon]|nr:hypothetical protein [archaeon]
MGLEDLIKRFKKGAIYEKIVKPLVNTAKGYYNNVIKPFYQANIEPYYNYLVGGITHILAPITSVPIVKQTVDGIGNTYMKFYNWIKRGRKNNKSGLKGLGYGILNIAFAQLPTNPAYAVGSLIYGSFKLATLSSMIAAGAPILSIAALGAYAAASYTAGIGGLSSVISNQRDKLNQENK